MAKLEFREYSINFLLITLAFVCVTTFIVGFMSLNGSPNSLIDEDKIPVDQFESQVYGAEDNASSWQQTYSDNPELEDTGSMSYLSLWSVMNLMTSSIGVTITLVFGTIFDTLGVAGIILGVITAIIIVSMIFAGWKTFRTGE